MYENDWLLIKIGAIKNGPSKDTGNIGHKRHRKKQTIKTWQHNTETKKMSNTDLIKNQGYKLFLH